MVIGAAWLGGARKPPPRSFVEEMQGPLTQVFVCGSVTNLFVAAKNDDGRPVKSILDVVDLKAWLGFPASTRLSFRPTKNILSTPAADRR